MEVRTPSLHRRCSPPEVTEWPPDGPTNEPRRGRSRPIGVAHTLQSSHSQPCTGFGSENTQIHFVSKFWPDFGLLDFVPIILDYQQKVWREEKQKKDRQKRNEPIDVSY